MPLGAHVSASGGLSTAIARAQAIGAECVQVFLSAPQRWLEPKHADDELERFAQRAREAGIGPNFAHAIYLINLASSEATIRARSIGSLIACSAGAGRCLLQGAVVHVGSGKGQLLAEAERNVIAALEEVLAGGGSTPILLENSAGSGHTLGARFEQLGLLLDSLGRPERMGVCLDTAHAFASGYDLRTPDGLEAALEKLDRHVGLERLRVVHANDSKVPLGSAVDRHENIGKGHLGEEAFALMLRHPALKELPWILEVPGYTNEGPDAENVAALKRLAGREPSAASPRRAGPSPAA